MPPSAPASTRQRRPARLRRLHQAALAGLALVLLDGLAWYGAQQALNRMVAGWSTHLRRQGWTVQPAHATQGGSPLTARLTLWNPRLEGPATSPREGLPATPTLAWGAERVTLSLSLLHPLTVRIGLDSPQAVQATTQGTTLAARIVGEEARILLPFTLPPGAPTGRATWAARALTIQFLDTNGHMTDLTLHAFSGHGLWNDHAGPDASRLALTSRAATLDLPPAWPLPPTPADAHRLRDAGLTLSLPGGPNPSLLVQDLHARWTHLALSVIGQARLSASSGAEGTLTLSVAGIGQTVRTLDQAGALSPDLARAVTMIDRLAIGDPNTPSSADAPPPTDRRLSLPLRLHAGMVFLGAMPLGHPTDWLK